MILRDKKKNRSDGSLFASKQDIVNPTEVGTDWINIPDSETIKTYHGTVS